MKAIALKDSGNDRKVVLIDVPRPVMTKPTEVLIKILCVGLDGTDREIITEKYGSMPPGEDQMIIGHESLGAVVEAGNESGLSVGDLVTILVRRPCLAPDCVNCRNGQPDFCLTGTFVERGIKQAHGYLCEYVVEDARYVVRIPNDCTHFGVLAEPQSIVEKVWNEVLRIQQRMIWEPRAALVTGSGPLGILAALTCRSLGLDTYVWSKSDEHSLNADMIRSCGGHYRQADASGNDLSFDSGLWKYAKGLNERIDIVWECSGHPPLAFEAMNVVGNNGVLALLSVTAYKRSMEVPVDDINQRIVTKNKCIVGAVNASRKDFETGLYRLQQIERLFPGQLSAMLKERMPLVHVPQLNFAELNMKAIVDVVPPADWHKWINQRDDIRII